jgi:phosphatidylglycerol:prolipoprotein diacylglycerol transferase
MRPILFRILLDHPWDPWEADVMGVPGIGAAVVWCVAGALVLAYVLWRRGTKWGPEDRANALVWGIGLLAVSFGAPRLPLDSWPLFGYGTLVLTGFLVGTWVGQQRAKRAGMDPAVVFDATFWTLVFGVLGGRLFYIVQHGERVFAQAQGLKQVLLAAINLTGGGLVLIGSMLGGAVGFFLLCRRRKVPALRLLDLLAPSIFIGIGFGRIGCMLYGCCFGDPSSLPWAVCFPQGNVEFKTQNAAFGTLVARGFLSPDAPATMPLHPTQLYSAFDGFLIALVTYAYYPFRRHVGGAFALGLILFPITRFFIEYLRADELGQLGTGLTISQLLSIGLLAAGLALAWWLSRRGEPVTPAAAEAASSRPA